MNKAALALIRKGAGIRDKGLGPETVGHSLDSFIGSWSAKEERVFLNSIAAHALETGADLLSFDAHFSAIEGLSFIPMK